MRGSEFVYDSVNVLYYNFNKVSLSRGGSYKDPPKWLKSKKAKINPQNKKDDKCFQYTLTVALNHEQIKNNPERISKIKPFISQYNWKEIDFPSHSKDWNKFESINKSTVNKWHYFAIKRLSALFRGITSKHDGDFYCLNCFQSYTAENKLKKHKNVCENHDYCYVEMREEYIKTLKYNEGGKSMRLPFIIIADLECLLEKINTCHNNPEKSSTTKINKHTPSGYSLFTHCSFERTKNKLDHYRSKNCMKKFCSDLREHATKIINYEKKEMIPLTKKEEKKHIKQEVCYICKKGFSTDDNNKKYKVRDHCHYTGKYRGAAHDICNLKYKIPKEIPVVFRNGSTYDYHFIIKELAEELEGEFECLGENTEKYITFSVPLRKEITKKDKNGNDKITKISYKIKFIDSYRFMSTSCS